MADAGSSIFNKKATEKLRSPDDLDKYVRVTNPSTWVILAACVALVLGLLAWGVFGSVSTNVAGTGVVVDGRALCFLSAEDVSKVRVGDVATFGNMHARVSDISEIPASKSEAGSLLKRDYLVETLFAEEWAYVVDFETEGVGELAEGVPLSVNIVVERIAPISLVFGERG